MFKSLFGKKEDEKPTPDQVIKAVEDSLLHKQESSEVEVETEITNLNQLGDWLPDKEFMCNIVDLKLEIHKLERDESKKRVWQIIDLPGSGHGLFPINQSEIEMITGPGKYMARILNNGDYAFNKMLHFEGEEEVRDQTPDADDGAGSDDTDSRVDDLLDRINTLEEENKELKTTAKSNKVPTSTLTFEQQLLMSLLTEKKKGGDINETLIQHVMQSKTAETVANADIKKAEIASKTEIEKMRLEIQKAQLELGRAIGDLPDEIKDGTQNKGLAKVVDGVQRFVDGVNTFLDKVGDIVQLAKDQEEEGDVSEADIEKEVNKLTGKK